MIDTYTSQNHRDFNSRYSHTYGWLVKKETKTLVYLHEGNEQNLVFTIGDSPYYTAKIDSGVLFEFIPIKRGWFNTKNNSVILERVPNRQWKRGICEGNTQALQFGKYGLSNINLDYFLLSEIFVNTTLITNTFVLNRIKNKLPVVLNNFFALDTNNSLYFYSLPIGKIENSTITLSNTMCEQELKDCIRDLNLNWSVKS
jgi:hypothetical protein